MLRCTSGIFSLAFWGWMDQWVRLHWCLHHHLHHCSKQQQQHHCSESQHHRTSSLPLHLHHGWSTGRIEALPENIHKFPRDASFIFVPGRPHRRVHPTSDIHGWVHWTQLSAFIICTKQSHIKFITHNRTSRQRLMRLYAQVGHQQHHFGGLFKRPLT